METLKPKELQVYKQEIEIAAQYSVSLEIKTKEDYEAALTEGKSIKDKLEKITSRKEEITKPLNAALKSTRDLFKPIEFAAESALSTIKRKMLAWNQIETKKAEGAKRKIAERVERQTMKPETAVRKIESIQAPESTVRTDSGKATISMIKKYYVTDKSKIPLEFLEPNMVAIKNAFRNGIPIPGVEEYEEANMGFGN